MTAPAVPVFTAVLRSGTRSCPQANITVFRADFSSQSDCLIRENTQRVRVRCIDSLVVLPW
jgi:hypothetical protein